MTLVRHIFAVLAIAVSIVGLAINLGIIVGSDASAARDTVGSLVHFWSFFTHLTNLWLILCYVSELTGWRVLSWLRQPVGRASMAASIMLVMGFYHFMLAPRYNFTGGLLTSNILMHYVAPVLYLAWWTAFASHGMLRFRDIPMMLIPGLVYVGYALLRGAAIGEYPYDILDVAEAGAGRVAISVAVLVAIVAAFCALLVVADRLLARLRPATSA
jgi:hypothetical protein